MNDGEQQPHRGWVRANALFAIAFGLLTIKEATRPLSSDAAVNALARIRRAEVPTRLAGTGASRSRHCQWLRSRSKRSACDTVVS